MVIDSLTSTNVYIEKKVLLNITANSIVNKDGRLEFDDAKNPLVTIIDSGDTPLYRLSKYTGQDKIMLYNETTKQVKFLEEGDFIGFNIDFARGTQYFIGADRIKSTSVKDGVFTIPLRNKKIFKIFLDGTEITMYNVDTERNLITLVGLDKDLCDVFSKIVCWVYDDNKITDENIKFVIEYYNYATIWEQETFTSGEYFEVFKGMELNYFESTHLNQTVVKTTYKNHFDNGQTNIINSIDNTVEINIFNGSDSITLPQYVGSDEFRLIFNNAEYGRVVLVNNCTLINGVSLSFEKEKNLERLNIACGNYIDINISDPSIYGKGKYGKGQYGSGTWVYNSARREV